MQRKAQSLQMIHVVKDFDHPPAALQSQEVSDAIVTLLTTGNRNVMTSDLYRGKTEQPDGTVKYIVVEALMQLYHDKCAYCECKEFDPQVEHYRPKNRVTSARGHTGYFWLAFEWSNLVSTCFDCNKIGKGKGNRFPLIGGETNRISLAPVLPDGALNPAQIRPYLPPLSTERPYLLHPEIDQPEQFFSFNNKGEIKGTDIEDRGKKTIEICNLNRRNLKYRRQKALDFYVTPIKDMLVAFNSNAIDSEGLKALLKHTFNRLRNWQSTSEEFSLYGQYTFGHFNKIIVPLLPKAYRKMIKEAFALFKAGQL